MEYWNDGNPKHETRNLSADLSAVGRQAGAQTRNAKQIKPETRHAKRATRNT